MTSEIDSTIDRLFDQFSVLAQVGYSGGALAGEQGIYRLTVPFFGKVMEGITIVSNLPELPYGANPVRVVQDATFKWLYVLCQQLQSQSPTIALLKKTYEWEMKMAAAAEEGRQLQLFRQFLSQKCTEVEDGISGVAVMQEIKQMALSSPTSALQAKCSRTTAQHGGVGKILHHLTETQARPFIEWLEPWMYE